MFQIVQELQVLHKIFNKTGDHLHLQKDSRAFNLEHIIKAVLNKFQVKDFNNNNSKTKPHKIKTIQEETMA